MFQAKHAQKISKKPRAKWKLIFWKRCYKPWAKLCWRLQRTFPSLTEELFSENSFSGVAAASEETIATEVNYEQSLYVHYYQTSLNVDTLANVQSLYRTCFACIDPAIVCFSFFPDFFALQNYVSCCMESLHFSFVNSNQNRFHFGELKLVLNGRGKTFPFSCILHDFQYVLES